MPDFTPDNTRAQSSIKSLNFELTNLTPSALITLFEIDLTKILKSEGLTLGSEAAKVGVPINMQDNILRFHNNIKIFNSYIIWRGQVYYPSPISAEGFEATTKGVLPQPTLSISSQSETGIDQIALLKHEISKFGDIIGAKVTRKRTFAKYLDRGNFLGSAGKSTINSDSLPKGYEPDPYAQLPSDVYYIERKQTENKTILTYQLSSALDLEGTKLPKRVVSSDKCIWQYRGIGCWYQHAEKIDNVDEDPVPLLEKAELVSINPDNLASGGTGLPKNSPPIANDKNERLWTIAGTSGHNQGPWKKSGIYGKGDYVFLETQKIKYYFVCIKENGSSDGDTAILPPNADYWAADECSKTLTGCRLRWGSKKGGVNLGSSCAIKKGELPFGGFPAARKISRQQ